MCCYELIAFYLYIIGLFPLAYSVIHTLLLTFSHLIAYLINALCRFLNHTRPPFSLEFDHPDPSLRFCIRFDSMSHTQADEIILVHKCLFGIAALATAHQHR